MSTKMTSLMGMAVAGVLASASAASADKCKVNIDIHNQKTMKIKALKIEYKFASDNKWRSEDLPNTEVGPGKTVRAGSNQVLADGEGEKMVGLKLRYQAWCGGKWSKEIIGGEDNDFDDTSACKNGRGYRYDVPKGDACD